MNLTSFYTAIGRLIIDTSTGRQTAIKENLNLFMKQILMDEDLEFALKRYSLVTADGTAEYALPTDYLKPYIKTDNTGSGTALEYIPLKKWRELYPEDSTSEGTPSEYTRKGFSRVYAQPSTASVIACVSSSTADVTTFYLNIVGTNSSGTIIKERVTLNGTTPVNSANTYTNLISIVKGVATTGTITCTSNSAAVTNISLLPAELSKEYWVIRLNPVPGATSAVELWYFTKGWDLANAEDYPIFPDECDNVLIYGTALKMMEQQGTPMDRLKYMVAIYDRHYVNMINQYALSGEDVRWEFGDNEVRQTNV